MYRKYWNLTFFNICQYCFPISGLNIVFFFVLLGIQRLQGTVRRATPLDQRNRCVEKNLIPLKSNKYQKSLQAIVTCSLIREFETKRSWCDRILQNHISPLIELFGTLITSRSSLRTEHADRYYATCIHCELINYIARNATSAPFLSTKIS